ncbi:MAG: lipid-transfer protein [Alphaproteobacteria bacterium]|nr:lipid-transfer protein [Alphaproteobacteria bacterium]
MSDKVIVAGVGMTRFVKPDVTSTYDAMGADAVRMALGDAGLTYNEIQQAYVGYVYGDSTSGQKTLYKVGSTGIPVINVNNNCATGSTALFLARQAVEAGIVDCALALGFEQMESGALGPVFRDRIDPLEDFLAIVDTKFEGAEKIPFAIRLFGGAGVEYQEKYDVRTKTFAKVRTKASQHAIHNERAIFRRPLEIEDVLDGNNIFLNLTKLQCCPPTCGAAAAVVCTDKFAKRHNLRTNIVIAGQAMVTDFPSSFEGSIIKAVGADMTAAAASQVYETTAIGAEDIDVVELHDCFTVNEVITYEALGLCPEGGAEKFIWDGDNTYGGSVVTNPSGGLLSKGHPLGATGLAQCYELVTQLRGDSGPRQVKNAQIALAHNLGLGGACVVTVYKKM